MKKMFEFAIVVLLLVGVWSTVEAQNRSFVIDRGARAYMDTLRWSNKHGIGTGGLIDTNAGASTKDTSMTFEAANLKSCSVVFTWTNAQGTAGGTHVMSCSLMVSNDGATWYTPLNQPVFTTAVSANPANSELRVYYSPTADSTALENKVAGPAFMKMVGSSRLFRFKTSQATGAADTTFLKAVMFRQYWSTSGP